MKDIINQSPPKVTFLLGLVGGVAVISTIGFFVLLGSSFNKTSGTATNVSATTGSTATAPSPTATQPQPTQPTGNNIQLNPITDEDHIRGSRTTAISVVEFSDIQCPFCQRFHPTMQRLISEYDGQVNWVYRHFPLDSIHPQARPAALAAECVADQKGNDAFWTYVDKLFENQATLGQATFERVAQEVGANVDQLRNCINSGKFATKVQSHADQAVAAGGRGTPYSVIVVGDQTIPVNGAVPYEQVKSIIDSLLN